MAEVYFSKDIEPILEKIDYSRLGKNVAIKTHFGERGCITYIDPKLVKKVYDKIVSLGKKCALIECNVLYRGSRTIRKDHLKIAKEHGFDFAPIDILDGEKGEEYIEVDVNGLVDKAMLGKGLKKYDSMVVLTHFKGHGFAGYGGVFKNIGMGLGSRAGKLHMHSAVMPYIDKSTCTGCETCIKNCPADAIALVKGKAEINQKKCIGCAMCVSVCPTRVVQVPWDGSTSEEVEKRIVDYTSAVMKIIPKEKMVFINVLKNITPECDCKSFKQKPMMEDIGVLFSYDPVAVDKASLDLAGEKFDKINKIYKSVQVNRAAEKGMGSKEYEIIEI